MSAANRWLGYWLRAIQESTDGAKSIPLPGPAPKGTWKAMMLALFMCIPAVSVSGMGFWAVHRALGAAFESTSDVIAPLMVWLGSGLGILTLVLAVGSNPV